MRWAADGDGETTFVDGEWTALTGQSVGRARGRGWMKVVHPDDAGYLRSFLRTARAAEADFEMQYRVRNLSGAYLWVRDEVRRLPLDGDARARRFEGVVRVVETAANAPMQAYGTLSLPSKIESIADNLLNARRLAAELRDTEMLTLLDAALLAVGYRLSRQQRGYH